MRKKILKFRRSELVDILTKINDYENGHDVKWPVNPVIVSDGEGLKLGSSLQEWKYMFEIDGVMAWIRDDQITNKEIEEAVEYITPMEIEEMLGINTDTISIMILER